MQSICFRLKIHSGGLQQNPLCPSRDSQLPQKSNYVVGPLERCMGPKGGFGPGAIKYLVCYSIALALGACDHNLAFFFLFYLFYFFLAV